MANVALAFEVLTKNSSEIAQIVDKLGGIINVLRIAPQLYAILQTINAHNAETPEESLPMQYGRQAYAEIKAFQRRHVLDEDGILGDNTWRVAKKFIAMGEAAAAEQLRLQQLAKK